MKNTGGISWPQAGVLTKQTKKAPHTTCAGAWRREKRSSGNLFQRLEAVSSEGTDTSLVTQQRKGASEH